MMKKTTRCLLVLLLLLGAMVEMKAADVYLLTAQTINGIVGNYEVPSNLSLLRTLLMAAMCIPLKSLPCPKRDSGSVSECQGVIRCSLQSMVISLR